MLLEAPDSSASAPPPCFDSPEQYVPGLVVDRAFLVELVAPAQRRAVVLAMNQKSWVDLGDLLVTLAEVIGHDPSWLEAIYDLLPSSHLLWPLVQSFDTPTLLFLVSFRAPDSLDEQRVAWEDFRSRVLKLLEARPEAAFRVHMKAYFP